MEKASDRIKYLIFIYVFSSKWLYQKVDDIVNNTIHIKIGEHIKKIKDVYQRIIESPIAKYIGVANYEDISENDSTINEIMDKDSTCSPMV